MATCNARCVWPKDFDFEAKNWKKRGNRNSLSGNFCTKKIIATMTDINLHAERILHNTPIPHPSLDLIFVRVGWKPYVREKQFTHNKTYCQTGCEKPQQQQRSDRQLRESNQFPSALKTRGKAKKQIVKSSPPPQGFLWITVRDKHFPPWCWNSDHVTRWLCDWSVEKTL